MGETKIFLRASAMAELDAHRSRLVRCSATTIQKVMRAFTARKKYTRMQQESIKVQSRWRGESGGKCEGFFLATYLYMLI